MRDVLPEDQVYLKKIQKSIEGTTNYYSFQRIDVPVLEYAEVFSKGAGDTSDIVEKEM
jgi:histidyl-tRNA synthetase